MKTDDILDLSVFAPRFLISICVAMFVLGHYTGFFLLNLVQMLERVRFGCRVWIFGSWKSVAVSEQILADF